MLKFLFIFLIYATCFIARITSFKLIKKLCKIRVIVNKDLYKTNKLRITLQSGFVWFSPNNNKLSILSYNTIK